MPPVDDRQARAWDALGLGPRWRLRDPAALARAPDEPASFGACAQPAAVGLPDEPVAVAVPDEPAAVAATDELAAVAATDAEIDLADDGDVRRAVALAASPLEAARRDPLIARLPWPALAEAVSGCRACALCAGRRRSVFGVGPLPAPWLLVGEAPGEQEDAQGEPFVGPAGRLLDQMLAAIGVDRASHAFIANVLKCRPPRNRDPSPEEVARCEPFLLRQVELLQPRLIVVLGRFAAQSLLRTDATIASLRGRVHRYRVGATEVPLVVTYHPAYLLRNLPDKAKAWADLRLARRAWEQAGPR